MSEVLRSSLIIVPVENGDGCRKSFWSEIPMTHENTKNGLFSGF